MLFFIEWGGRLVFDAYNPKVFAEYCERATAGAAAGAATAGAVAGATAEAAEATASRLAAASLESDIGLEAEDGNAHIS